MALFSLPLSLIILRESLEAFLIVSIFAGMAVKMGRPQARRFLYFGTVAALLLTVVAGAAITETMSLTLEENGAEPVFVGVVSLVAVAVITYMVVWMYRNTLTMMSGMHERTATAFSAGKPSVLFGLAFVAVIREGMEAVILIPTVQAGTGALGVILSAAAGLTASALLGVVIFKGFVRLSLSRFFAVSGLLLIVFGAGLAGTAVHELTADRLIEGNAHWQAWDLSSVFPDEDGLGAILESTIGYHAAPSWLDVLAYCGYLGGMLTWYIRGTSGKRHHAKPSDAIASPGD